MPGTPGISEADIDRFYTVVGDRVRSARGGRSMSQAALAQRIGFTRSSVANLEAGRQRIALHLFVRIARALSVDFVELLPTEAVMSPKDGTAILENLEERLTATPSSTKEFVRGAVAQLLPDSHEG